MVIFNSYFDITRGYQICTKDVTVYLPGKLGYYNSTRFVAGTQPPKVGQPQVVGGTKKMEIWNP